MSTSTTVDTDRIVEDLTYAFDGVHDRAAVTAAVQQAHTSLLATATVTTYLPVLVARFARETLVAEAQRDGRQHKAVPEILFVCVQNAGRSQLAAAIAAHLAPGRVHVRSAGSQPVGAINPLVVEVLAERGISVAEAYPKPMTDSVLDAADVIVTMGCGDECPYFPGKRYEDWDVIDPDGATLDQARDIRDDVQHRVTALLRDLDL